MPAWQLVMEGAHGNSLVALALDTRLEVVMNACTYGPTGRSSLSGAGPGPRRGLAGPVAGRLAVMPWVCAGQLVKDIGHLANVCLPPGRDEAGGDPHCSGHGRAASRPHSGQAPSRAGRRRWRG